MNDTTDIEQIPSGQPMIELRDVSKWFGDFQALKDVNLDVASG